MFWALWLLHWRSIVPIPIERILSVRLTQAGSFLSWKPVAWKSNLTFPLSLEPFDIKDFASLSLLCY